MQRSTSTGSMKIRRSSSVNIKRGSHAGAWERGGGLPGAGASALAGSSRLSLAAFYLVVFASGCFMTAWLLSLSPQGALERGPAGARLAVLVKPGGESVSRRSLYTAGSGGVVGRLWDGTRTPLMPSALLPQQQQQLGQQAAVSFTAATAGADSAGANSAAAGSGAPPPPPPPPDEPPDFDWKAYLLRYPDLRAGNIRTRAAAAWHYAAKGRAEQRSYTRVPVLLRYTACQGLFNQMYAHLNALVLADFLGADVMLAPSVYRESFAKYFSMDLAKNEVKWTPAPTGALLDVPAITAHYARKGMRVLPTAAYESFPDCMHPQDAFPRYVMPDVEPEQVVRLSDTYLQSMHVWYIWDRAAEAIMAKHSALVAAGRPPNTTVVLDLPCPFLSIMTLTCMEAAQEAATALKFNSTLVGYARRIIAGMRAAGVSRYNGAHLRLEKDAVDWARILGGMKKYMDSYAASFAAAGFSRRKDLYVASGLLSYNASKEMNDMMTFLGPHARSVQYKELYLPQELLHSLNPEQEALIDFLVLANADNFVGLGSSTFSVYLREYRVLLGHARLADVFVDTSRIGTDALFERCTHFAPLDTTTLATWHKPQL